MAAIGGSPESLTLDGREFPILASATVKRVFGGFENEVDLNGDGSARLLKTRKALAVKDIVVEIDDDRGDHEFLQAFANRNDFGPFGVTFVGGNTYGGVAQITGEVEADTAAASATLSLMGPGEMTKL